TYNITGKTVVGLGAMKVNGGIDAKMVTASEDREHYAGSVSAKTVLGPVTLGWTYFNGVRDDNDTGAQLYNRIIDNTFKIGYDTGKWNFQAFLSAEKVDWKTPLANYHVLTGDFAGDTFHTVEIKRQRADLWALYDLGSG